MRPTKRPPTKASIQSQNQQNIQSPFPQREPTWSHPNTQPFQNTKPQSPPVEDQPSTTRMQSTPQVPEHKTSQRHSNHILLTTYRNTNQ